MSQMNTIKSVGCVFFEPIAIAESSPKTAGHGKYSEQWAFKKSEIPLRAGSRTFYLKVTTLVNLAILFLIS